MLTVFGSTAIDTIRTPKKILKNVLGGAATFAAISASNFVDTGLIAVVGKDFPKEFQKILSTRLDLKGLTIKEGKTFRYDGKFDNTLSTRETLKTELNVLGDFEPEVPEEYRKSQFVYLANNDPDQNIKVINQFEKIKFSMCDTIDFWISTKRESVIKMIKAVDAVVINDEEAKLLTKEFNLIKCAKKMMGWGAKYVIIKKGEHGSLMFFDDVIFPSAGFSLEDVVDPTGAGDTFAGGFAGYIAQSENISFDNMKNAIIYGSALASYCVEKFGTERMLELTKKDINGRLKQFKSLTQFDIELS